MTLEELNEKIREFCQAHYKLSILQDVLDYVDYAFHMGSEEGYDQGYQVCLKENVTECEENDLDDAWEEGRRSGYEEGYDEGRDEGREYGYNEGLESARIDMMESWNAENYEKVFEEGYNAGVIDSKI